MNALGQLLLYATVGFSYFFILLLICTFDSTDIS